MQKQTLDRYDKLGEIKFLKERERKENTDKERENR